MAPGICEFASAPRHNPSLPGRHVPPVPVIPMLPWDCDQHTPVTGSEIAPPGQGAAEAGEALIIGADSSAPAQAAAASRREAVNRIVIMFSVGKSVGRAVRTAG